MLNEFISQFYTGTQNMSQLGRIILALEFIPLIGVCAACIVTLLKRNNNNRG